MTDIPVRLLLTAEAEAAEAELRELGGEMRRLGQAATVATADSGAAVAVLGRNSAVSAGQVGNLAAQFNDIGIMLAAGQSPFQLAIQQGSQISQVLGPMGAGGAVRALFAAFTSLLNPVSLITIGSIAAGAATVQWLTEAGDEARSLEDVMDDLADATSRLEAARKAAATPFSDLIATYGAEAKAAREMLEIEKQIAEVRHRRAFEEAAIQSSAALGGAGIGDKSAAEITLLGEIVRARRESAAAAEVEIDRLAVLGRARTDEERARLESAKTTRAAAIALLEENAQTIEGIMDIQKMLGVSEEAAFRLAAAMAEVRDASSAEEQAAALQKLAQHASDATNEFSTGTGEALDLYQALLDAVKAGLELSNLDVGKGIRNAVETTNQLIERLNQARGLSADVATGGNVDFFDPRNEAGLSGRVLRDRPVPLQNRPGYKPPRSGGGGGGGSPDSFASLSAEADKALASLSLAIAAINEKVQAGLSTTAEGQEAVRGAISSTADAIADLIPRLDQAADKAGPGAKAKVAELRAELKRLSGDLNETAKDLSKTFADSLGRSMTDFASGTKSAKDAFADFGRTVLNEISRILAQRFTQRFISPLIDSLLSFIPLGGGGAGLSIGNAAPAAPAMNASPGAVFGNSALRGLAPLANAAPAQAGGGYAQNVTVNITNAAPGTEARATERQDGSGRVLDVMIEQVEAAIASNTRRGVGPLAGVLGQNYGLGQVPR